MTEQYLHEPDGAPATSQRLAHPVLLKDQEWPETAVPVVSICCITYQHAAFIRECLDGFLMQETTFPVEILIHDDASTDGTAEVIRDYESRHPKLIKPIYQKENQYSKKIKPNITFNFPRAKGTYIAICEGDDYWTDPHKLSKQVKFLDEHREYSMCWTRFNIQEDKKRTLSIDKNGKYFSKSGVGCDFTFETFAEGWHIGMQTIVFRSDYLLKSNILKNENFRDVFLISELLSRGKGYCINEVMAVYRIHDGGIYSGADELARAEVGSRTYKSIYLHYPGNIHLQRKYHDFNWKYIKLLARKRNYTQALAMADEEVRLIFPTTDYLEEFLKYVEEILRQKDQELDYADKLLADLRGSQSFKIGRALTWPARLLGRIWKRRST